MNVKRSMSRTGPSVENTVTRWSRLLGSQSHATTIMDLYKNTGVPDDLRDLCQEWFENVPWLQLASEDQVQMSEKGELLIKELEEQVSIKRKNVEGRYQKTKMSNLMKELKSTYSSDAGRFVIDVAKCVSVEMSLLGEAVPNIPGSGMSEACQRMHQDWSKMCNGVLQQALGGQSFLDQQKALKPELERVTHDAEQFVNSIKRQQLEEGSKGLEVQRSFQQHVINLEIAHREVAKGCGELITEHLRKLTSNIYQLVDFWKLKQKEELVTGIPPPSLSELQELFGSATRLLHQTQGLLGEQERLMVGTNLHNLQNGLIQTMQLVKGHLKVLSDEFELLVRRSFLFEQLPRTESRSTPAGNVRSTNAKFSCVVRSLLPPDMYGQTNMPRVQLYLVKDEAMQHLNKEKTKENDGNLPLRYQAGEVSNGTKNMEAVDIGAGGKCTCARMTGLQLKERNGKSFRRPPGVGNQEVWEQRFAVLARCRVVMGTVIYCDTLAYPVVVTVQSSQDADALATLFWFSAFCAPVESEPTPKWVNQVEWGTLADSLDKYMRRESGRGLNHNDRHFLGRKFLVHHTEEDEITDKEMVMWNTFNKDRVLVNGRAQKFTAWKWFLGITYLVKTCVRDEWFKGNLVGFINKSEAVNLLLRESGQATSTIVLRFAETKQHTKQASAICGRCSFSYIYRAAESSKSFVDHYLLKPEEVTDLPQFIRNTRICNEPVGQVICVDEKGNFFPRLLEQAYPKPTSVENSDDEYPDSTTLHLLDPTKTVEQGTQDPPSVRSNVTEDHDDGEQGMVMDEMWALTQSVGDTSSSTSIEIPAETRELFDMVDSATQETTNRLLREPMNSGPGSSGSADTDLNIDFSSGNLLLTDNFGLQPTSDPAVHSIHYTAQQLQFSQTTPVQAQGFGSQYNSTLLSQSQGLSQQVMQGTVPLASHTHAQSVYAASPQQQQDVTSMAQQSFELLQDQPIPTMSPLPAQVPFSQSAFSQQTPPTFVNSQQFNQSALSPQQLNQSVLSPQQDNQSALSPQQCNQTALSPQQYAQSVYLGSQQFNALSPAAAASFGTQAQQPEPLGIILDESKVSLQELLTQNASQQPSPGELVMEAQTLEDVRRQVASTNLASSPQPQ